MAAVLSLWGKESAQGAVDQVRHDGPRGVGVVLHQADAGAPVQVDNMLAGIKYFLAEWGSLLNALPVAPAGWASGLAGVTVLGVHNGQTRLRVAPGTDDQSILAAGCHRAAGRAGDHPAVVPPVTNRRCPCPGGGGSFVMG
ncbi:hypothetical protein [Actinokineospora cianjurensis]|uniref:hypothetical protein n=1 Tax=Actinokineospora cianjurensis TaxID=585224 RepID=UPI001B869A50|nr:hypothetical protein [Actinokineospora cianjurensis]